MPLSHEDRQKLDEIERELTRADPELAAAITAGRLPLLIPMLYAAAFVAAGAVLVGGLVTTHTYPITGAIIAVAGAAIMTWSAGRSGMSCRRTRRRPSDPAGREESHVPVSEDRHR